jgi:UDP-glucuronate 4-epimerase
MAHTYTHLFGFQTIGLRFFTVYGPWGRPDMAMWLFTEAMVNGRPIQVYNFGKMSRDFTYVDDVIEGVKAALWRDSLDPVEIINLGNHRPENLMDMIGLLAREVGTEPRLEMLPMQPGDVEATCADIALARRKLGFEPKTPLSAGIPKFVAWYREYHRP